MAESNPAIENLFSEARTFPPPEDFKARALVSDWSLHEQAERDLEGFWAEQAGRLRWTRQWDRVLEWELPFAKWFVGGQLNVSDNCLDRHVEAGGGDKVAYHWVGEPGDDRTITYTELRDEVARFANALKSLGVRKGDRVNIYMGMVPELPVAMLACARLGAPHSVVFGGFSADALRDRINDAEAKVLITQDEGWRTGKVVPLKRNADEAVADAPTIEKVVVLRRTGNDVPWSEDRDVWWQELVEGQPADCPPEPMDAEDLLYLLYTSGTTAKPKGIMHTTGGYLAGVSATHRLVFDLHPDEDVYWCAADIGWVTGHSYIVYGPLANHTTGVLYEGAPNFPEKDRWWEIVERYKVTILYTAPTAIRTFMKWGEDWPAKHDLSSLRLLGTVGEPINPEAWVWYQTNVGGGRCPVVDTWWQTETGMILVTPLPGVVDTKPGSATFPFPGVDADIVDNDGRPVGIPGGGYLVLKKPWPAMLRGIYGDPERYKETYWSRFEGLYFAGDGAKRDEDGYFWLLGRVDDVMNVSGHRISTTEVESALVDHKDVAEAAVIGKVDERTGQQIVAFVTLKGGVEPAEDTTEVLRDHVARKIGKLARPTTIIFTPDLPKTRSGKIMRRLLKDVAEERELGDVTTLADPAIVEEIRDKAAARPQEE
jgi:acetyl-CoA synthetase